MDPLASTTNSGRMRSRVEARLADDPADRLAAAQSPGARGQKGHQSPHGTGAPPRLVAKGSPVSADATTSGQPAGADTTRDPTEKPQESAPRGERYGSAMLPRLPWLVLILIAAALLAVGADAISNDTWLGIAGGREVIEHGFGTANRVCTPRCRRCSDPVAWWLRWGVGMEHPLAVTSLSSVANPDPVGGKSSSSGFLLRSWLVRPTCLRLHAGPGSGGLRFTAMIPAPPRPGRRRRLPVPADVSGG